MNQTANTCTARGRIVTDNNYYSTLFVCVFDGFAVKNLLSNTLSHPADT
jgi:hypothetical protein